MTAVDRSLALAVFIMCLSMGITIFNDINEEAEFIQNGEPLITEFIDLNELEIGGESGLNSTTNDLGNYQKPEEVTQDFGFTHGIRVFNIIVNTVINATYGFSSILTNFGIPDAFATPIGILINLNYVFLMIYTILGKSY